MSGRYMARDRSSRDVGICWFRCRSSHCRGQTPGQVRSSALRIGNTPGPVRYLAELLPESFLRDPQRPHPSDPAGRLHLVHVQALHSFFCDQLRTQTSREPRPDVIRTAPPEGFGFTLSSARMARSFMMSWKRRKLLVPMDCSSRRRQRATSWGRVRLSSVSSSSNSLENLMICSLLGRSPESRICGRHQNRCQKLDRTSSEAGGVVALKPSGRRWRTPRSRCSWWPCSSERSPRWCPAGTLPFLV